MHKKSYVAKCGLVQYKPSFRWLQSVLEGESNEGFCLACGETNDGIEPDARKYHCQCCNAPKVYGAENLLLMNLYFQ
jgi:hypothetical protein